MMDILDTASRLDGMCQHCLDTNSVTQLLSGHCKPMLQFLCQQHPGQLSCLEKQVSPRVRGYEH